jgi:uncharacterized protein YdbL (DUF1318 family)
MKEPKKIGDVFDASQFDISKMLDEVTTTQPTSYVVDTEDVVEELKLLQPIEKEVAMDIVNGHSMKSIAIKLGLELPTVKMIRHRKRVREFISGYLKDVSIKEKQNREDLIAQIVEARLNNLDENEDMSTLSNKDTLDLIMALDSIQKEREKVELGTKENAVVNILNLIKKD